MHVGLIGVGKLGLPVAVALERHGHVVHAYDVNPAVAPGVRPEALLLTREAGPGNVGELIDTARLTTNIHFYLSAAEVCAAAEIVFVAVQTPHAPEYEGATRVPSTRADFNYDWLCAAISAVSAGASALSRALPVVVISTVLPGTVRERILPLLHANVRLCYNPFFIAMGTVYNDFCNPEFVLLGRYDSEAGALLKRFYATIHDAPVYETTIENAELIKVTYNTFIGMKIAFINTVMEICNQLPGTDVDSVSAGIALANKRLISPAYLRGGMGDGGGCHPRDNIAMSWLADKLGLSYNFFDAIMTAREKQTEFLASLIEAELRAQPALPVIILGKAFKPDTNLVTGSPAVLLGHILVERSVPFAFRDPYCCEGAAAAMPVAGDAPAIFFIGCKHTVFVTTRFPTGSIVLDPHRYIPTPADASITVHYIGVGPIVPDLPHGVPAAVAATTAPHVGVDPALAARTSADIIEPL